MNQIKNHIFESLKENNINESDVTNIYIFGSWLHQTNRPESDFDVIIVGRFNQRPIKFRENRYFHKYNLVKIAEPIKTDLVLYSNDNFEKLLETQFMVCLDCIFAPDNLIFKNDIDYKNMYLTKYYSEEEIKQAVIHEIKYSVDYMDKHLANTEDKKMIIKKLFNAIRYIYTQYSLIQNKNIIFGNLIEQYKLVLTNNDIQYTNNKLKTLTDHFVNSKYISPNDLFPEISYDTAKGSIIG